MTHLLRQSFRAIVYPRNEPTLLGLVYPSDSSPAQVLDKLGKRNPPGRIHVKMVAVLDELLVDVVRLDTLRPKPAGEELDEVVLKLHGEVGDMLACTFANDEHLAEMRLGLGVTFESVLIPALLLADLAVPTQALKALGLHLVGEVLRCTD